MDKKKNYSKKAGGKGLMAAISDYQRENKQKETYKPKNTPKLDSNKAKNNTSQAYGSGKNFGALLKKDPPKKNPPKKNPPKKDPPKKDPPKKDPPKKDPPKTPNRVSKFLGGQTIKQVQEAAKKREEKKSRSPYARQQADLDRLRKAQAEERKKRKTKGRSSWAKGQLKGL